MIKDQVSATLKKWTKKNDVELTEPSGADKYCEYTQPKTRNEPSGRGGRQLVINTLAGSGGNVIKIGLQLIMLPLMAHLLGPKEFGIYGLALPTVIFFVTLADGGLGMSLARDTERSVTVWSTAFWLMLLIGAILAAVVFIWGVILSAISHEEKLRNVMAVLSLSLVFLSISVLPSARLFQQRRLVIISAADVVGSLIGSITAVIFAYHGAGALSLAIQYVVGFLVRAIIFNFYAFVRPSRIFKLSSLTGHISLGSSVLSTRLADFSGRLTENLLYARAFGASALGMYTFSNQVPRFLTEAASNPSWSALYAYSLHDKQNTRDAHAKVIYALCLALAPIVGILVPLMPTLLVAVLGEKWIDALPLLQVLLPFYAISVLFDKSGAILLARGYGWTAFSLSLILVCGRVAAVEFGSVFGPVGVAWSIGFIHIIFSVSMLIVPARLGLTEGLRLILQLYCPILAGFAAGLASFYTIGYTSMYIILSPFWLLFYSVLNGVIAYSLILLCIDRKRVLHESSALVDLIRR